MSFWVYILRCRDNSYYTGHTDDLERRVAQHHIGISECYTKDRRPVELVFSQEFGTRDEALRAEFQIKGWTRRKKEALMNQNWKALSHFARGKNKKDRG
jgi:tRNA/rRNA methyltransferase